MHQLPGLFSSVFPPVLCEPEVFSSPLARGFFIGHASGFLRAESSFFPFGSQLCISYPVWCTRCWPFFIVFLSAFRFSLSAAYLSPENIKGIKQKSPLLPGGRKAALQTADYLEGFGSSAMPKAARKGSIPFLSPCGCPFLTWSRGRAGRPPAPHIPFCRRRGSG